GNKQLAVNTPAEKPYGCRTGSLQHKNEQRRKEDGCFYENEDMKSIHLQNNTRYDIKTQTSKQNLTTSLCGSTSTYLHSWI
uniref:Uncharacterized protein n=1 Tax=Anopheles atroparvus TaxID=41427 RepID=A0AAG5CX86_ANOAO